MIGPDDPAQRLGQALLDALRTLPGNSTDHPEWIALAAEAKRRGKSTRQFRAWCRDHGVEIRQDNHRDAWVRPTDVDRAVAGMPLAAQPTRGDEIDQELRKVWSGNSPQRPASGRAPRRTR